jgi:hypothetical protein
MVHLTIKNNKNSQMKQNNFLKSIILSAGVLFFASCSKKLDLFPSTGVTSETVFTNMQGYNQAMAKVYGSFGIQGQPDLQGFDEGFSEFFREFWTMQELPTEEAVTAWGGADNVGLPDIHAMSWTSSNQYSSILYYRCYAQITLCNNFVLESTDEKLSQRGITGASADTVKYFRNEARFLRAYQYWVLMDLFGNPSFVTETSIGSINLPKQISRKDLFTYIESELKDIDAGLPPPRYSYGQADKAAAWALLARMYLNAEVYTGTPRYPDAITYAKKVIDAGYTLIPDYTQLMRADNYKNTSEFIFPIKYDGRYSQSFGGSTFLQACASGGSMPVALYGTGNKWAGFRTTSALVDKFQPSGSGQQDLRGTQGSGISNSFYTDGQSKQINDISSFTDGYGVIKYKNINRDGTPGSNQTFSDVDVPLFRLAEIYLIYAEATIRGGAGGDLTAAKGYLNKLRERAFNGNSGDFNDADMTMANIDATILDERARELYWEGFRRMDLIRFGKFTGNNYVWPWKGGIKGGGGVADFRKLYPIPAAEINANTNLIQNTGY